MEEMNQIWGRKCSGAALLNKAFALALGVFMIALAVSSDSFQEQMGQVLPLVLGITGVLAVAVFVLASLAGRK